MNRIYSAVFAVCLAMVTFAAAAAPLQPALAGLGFLVGTWTGEAGKVADTGGSSQGVSQMSAEAGGAVLLRRDHVALFDKAGKPTGGFDILMTIYAEGGAVHADYFDGDHIIHYSAAAIVPGKSVTFTSTSAPGTPTFRLIYTQTGQALVISFAMAPPGQTSFHPIADGAMHRVGSVR